MQIDLLNSTDQFEKLQKGDLILVKWSDYFIKHHPNSKNIMFYKVYENKANQNEIICQKKGNHYFNYEMYLGRLSCALEVYRVLDNKSIENELIEALEEAKKAISDNLQMRAYKNERILYEAYGKIETALSKAKGEEVT